RLRYSQEEPVICSLQEMRLIEGRSQVTGTCCVKEGIAVDLAKVAVVQDSEQLGLVTEARSFLGLAG
ncbi:hypothetical protein PJP07_30285, partial [Mycobacterium kansasii]